MFASDWLDAGKLDHLRPFLGFVGDQFSEFGGCHRHRYNAQTDKVSFDFGIGHNGIDRAVELFDNFVGGVLGGNDTVPTARLVAVTDSPMAGISGSASTRAAVVTPRARNLPVRMYSIAEPRPVNVTCTCPASRSGMELVRYGT